MDIRIIAVGKIREKYINLGIREFENRLKNYGKMEIIEVPDLPDPKNLTPSALLDLITEEGEEIISKIDTRDYNVALDIGGKLLSSEELAEMVEDTMIQGIYPRITFIIGGSNGLSPQVLSKCQLRLSFGKMTYPHQLMRLILLEQIYRSFRIIHNHPYHK